MSISIHRRAAALVFAACFCGVAAAQPLSVLEVEKTHPEYFNDLPPLPGASH